MVHKTVCCWHKTRHKDQWNRIESPEINPCMYSHLNFNKVTKNIQCGKDSFFNKWFKKIGYSYAKEGNFTIIYTQNKKTIQNKDLNKDLNLENEENMGSKLIDISLGNNLLDLAAKAKIYHWDYIKLKSFSTEKKTINKMKRQSVEWVKISQDKQINMG